MAVTYYGPVTISLPNEPGVSGTTSARNGVATFTGLTVSGAGQGGSIQISAAGFNPISGPHVHIMQPSVPTPPTVQSELVLTTQKTNKKGKKIGKPVFTGFKLVFSEAMSPAITGSRAGYQVDKIITKTVKRKKMKSLVPVGFTPIYNQSNNSVSLMISGKNLFKLGGQITIVTTPPNAVSSSAGVAALSGVTVFHILPNAKNITTGSAALNQLPFSAMSARRGTRYKYSHSPGPPPIGARSADREEQT